MNLMPELWAGSAGMLGWELGQSGASEILHLPPGLATGSPAGALHCLGPTRALGLVPWTLSGVPRITQRGWWWGAGANEAVNLPISQKVGSPGPGPLSQGGHAVPVGSCRVPTGGSSLPDSWAWSQLLTGTAKSCHHRRGCGHPVSASCCDRHADITIQSCRPEFRGQVPPWLGSGED